MEDIFTICREGNALKVKMWLNDVENDPNIGDDHRFSPLHWASKEGRGNVVEMLLYRGARVNATNMGDDTALHLAAAHNHIDVVRTLLRNKADVNIINEHGNTPLHYACFWGFHEIAEELVSSGALVTIVNKYKETPLDKCKPSVASLLQEKAVSMGQDLNKTIPYRDQSWRGTKTRSRDATLSRHSGIDIKQLRLQCKVSSSHSGDVWRGLWQGNDIVAKVLNLRGEVTARACRDFQEEYPKLRIFSHPNILPVLGACNHPPNLVIISQFQQFGSLYNVLHEQTGIVVDTGQALRFAVDIGRGMAFLHTLDPLIPRYYLSSKHVMVDEDLTARINMADTKFSFLEKGKLFSPAWMAPEALQKKPDELNVKAADMWSFAVLLWELASREVPFADKLPMEVGMQIATEGLRVVIPPGISHHMSRLISICMNEDPGKRPTFDMVLPILEKMKLA